MSNGWLPVREAVSVFHGVLASVLAHTTVEKQCSDVLWRDAQCHYLA